MMKPERGGRTPTPGRRLSDAEHHRHHRGRDDDRTGNIELPIGRLSLIRGQQFRRNRQHDIDEKIPSPVEELGEHTAEQRSDRATRGGHDAPGRERDVTPMPFGVGDEHDRQRRRCEQRTRATLDRASGDEHAVRDGEAGHQRSKPEDDHGDDEPPPLLRPNRSARRPPSSRKPPNTSVYAVTTHWRFSGLRPKELWIEGSATFTIVVSRITMNCASATRTRTPYPPIRRVAVDDIGIDSERAGPYPAGCGRDGSAGPCQRSAAR
jgi:hypothetical protein